TPYICYVDKIDFRSTTDRDSTVSNWYQQNGGAALTTKRTVFVPRVKSTSHRFLLDLSISEVSMISSKDNNCIYECVRKTSKNIPGSGSA
ncbi:hypothetical protein WA026_023030, partial [Henosepilachna vigintioctopunctata]